MFSQILRVLFGVFFLELEFFYLFSANGVFFFLSFGEKKMFFLSFFGGNSLHLSQLVFPLNCLQISCAAVSHPIEVKIVADRIGSYWILYIFFGSYKSLIGSYWIL